MLEYSRVLMNQTKCKLKHRQVYTDCACTPRPPPVSDPPLLTEDGLLAEELLEDPWHVTAGPCPVDCTTKFYMFLAVVCMLKFSGATGRASNFLVSVRSADPLLLNVLNQNLEYN